MTPQQINEALELIKDHPNAVHLRKILCSRSKSIVSVTTREGWNSCFHMDDKNYLTKKEWVACTKDYREDECNILFYTVMDVTIHDVKQKFKEIEN